MSLLEKLTRIEPSKRAWGLYGLISLFGCLCYTMILHPLIHEHDTVARELQIIQKEYTEQNRIISTLSKMQLNVAEKKDRLKQLEEACFSPKGAAKFLESLNVAARVCHLTILSQKIFEPRPLVMESISKQDANYKRFEKQSVNTVFSGNHRDISRFLEMLTQQKQKVEITDFRIGLPPGEQFNPKAWLTITAIIDTFQEREI